VPGARGRHRTSGRVLKAAHADFALGIRGARDREARCAEPIAEESRLNSSQTQFQEVLGGANHDGGLRGQGCVTRPEPWPVACRETEAELTHGATQVPRGHHVELATGPCERWDERRESDEPQEPRDVRSPPVTLVVGPLSRRQSVRRIHVRLSPVP
jgi:hypothetical protein